ncbi:MAG: four helix bundle protein [Ignavibacteriaceae bacterium]|nr:four helix bundle protein [Ignavibacteriaceae bacterium]MCU0406762.1 four helix bundle protein [Ignavibacteriaceae bacterium]
MSEKKYQDIKLRSYNFALSVIRYIDSVKVKRVFYSMIDQLLRSSTSIGANLIEAKSSHSKKDFIKYYEIALKSSNETKFWICLLRDGLKLNKVELNNLLSEVNEISKVIASIVIRVKDTKANIIKEKYVKYSSHIFDETISVLKEQYSK